MDNQIRVATPENISFYYEVTGPFRRLMAYLADVCITIAAFVILSIAIWLLFALAAVITQTTQLSVFFDALSQLATGFVLAAAFLSLWFYGAYMETNFNGQTFGKMIANVRTISVDGSSIDASQAALRNFFRLLDVSPFVSMGLIFGPELEGGFPLPIFAFGFICMIISPRYQRIGDLVAGTMVVSEETKWTHGLAKFSDNRIPALADLIPEGFVVTPMMAKTLAEYVDRRRVLPLPRANEIASHWARPLIQLFGLQADTNPDLLLCALYFKTFSGEEDGKRSNFLLVEPDAALETSPGNVLEGQV